MFLGFEWFALFKVTLILLPISNHHFKDTAKTHDSLQMVSSVFRNKLLSDVDLLEKRLSPLAIPQSLFCSKLPLS